MKVWSNAAAAAFFFTVAVVSLVRGDYWFSLFQVCAAAVFGLLAVGADERGGALAATMWVLIGAAVLCFAFVILR